MGRQSTACQLKVGSDDDDDELKWGILPETVATTSATTIAWTTATTKAILQATACPLLSLLIQRKLCFCVSTFDGPLFQFSGTPKVNTETPMLAASVSIWWGVLVMSAVAAVAVMAAVAGRRRGGGGSSPERQFGHPLQCGLQN